MGKPTPRFWWKFSVDDSVIVRCDYTDDILAEFSFIGDASFAIDSANKLIQDFESGRKNFRKSKTTSSSAKPDS